MEERGYAGLTVADVAERADVGRATFYLHYTDKDELLLDALEQLLDELAAQLRPLTAADLLGGHDEEATTVFRHVGSRAGLYRALLRDGGSPAASARLRDYFVAAVERNTTARLVADAPNPVPAGLLAASTGGSLLGLITWWLDNGRPLPPEQMGRLFQQLATHGAAHVLGLSAPGSAESSP